MNKAVPALLLAVSAVLVSSCKDRQEVSQPSNASSLNSNEKSARFYSDLGPATVDVSSYPEGVRKDYETFLAVCSSCHTSARPLNAPMADASDWKRFIHRMHVRASDRGFTLTPEDEKQVLNFLVHDSKIRKIDRKKEFQAQQENLKNLFAEVTKERERLLSEETKRLPIKESPYVGVK